MLYSPRIKVSFAGIVSPDLNAEQLQQAFGIDTEFMLEYESRQNGGGDDDEH